METTQSPSTKLVPLVVAAVASLVGNLARDRVRDGGAAALVGAAVVGAFVGAGIVVLAVPESTLRAIRREVVLRARTLLGDPTLQATRPSV